MKERIYISGPMTHGDRLRNLSEALAAFRDLIRLGYAPLCPQLTYFAETFMPELSHAEWLAIDLPWVRVADAVYRLDGYSEGADREVREANLRGKPVFFQHQGGIAALDNFFSFRGETA